MPRQEIKRLTPAVSGLFDLLFVICYWLLVIGYLLTVNK
jgi:hypothetical protein